MLAWWGNALAGAAPGRANGSGPMRAGSTYYRECRRADGSLGSTDRFVYQPSAAAPAPAAPAAPPPPPDAYTIALQVYREVPLVFPQPHTSPPAGGEILVGFPVWFWVDGAVWRSFEAHAAVAGVSVQVVAHPQRVVWDLGDGTSLDCHGPGTPWQQGARGSNCAHAYQFVSAHQPGGRYAGHVTVTWSVTWSASTGEGGALPDASRSTPFSLTVTQRQAVIHYGT